MQETWKKVFYRRLTFLSIYMLPTYIYIWKNFVFVLFLLSFRFISMKKFAGQKYRIGSQRWKLENMRKSLWKYQTIDFASLDKELRMKIGQRCKLSGNITKFERFRDSLSSNRLLISILSNIPFSIVSSNRKNNCESTGHQRLSVYTAKQGKSFRLVAVNR